MLLWNTLKYLYETIFRTFPVSAKTGLRIFGAPDDNSPILVTGNFTLTVRMMVNMIKKTRIDCYLLVTNTGGVNIWCASGGGHFSHKEILAVIKTSEIAQLTKKRTLIFLMTPA